MSAPPPVGPASPPARQPASLLARAASPRARSCHTLTRGDRQAELALAHDRVDPRDVAAHRLQPPVVVQLPGRHLEPEVEQLFLGLAQPGHQLVVGELAQLGRSGPCGHQTSPTSRLTNRHFIGSLWIARRIASRAIDSGTPASSNMTRPGLTLA